MHVHEDDLRLLAEALDLPEPEGEGVVHRAVHEDAAAQVERRHRDPRAPPLADVRPAAGLAGGVVERAEELGNEVDDAQDLLLVPDVVARGEAVDPHVEDLVADVLRDPEAARRVLDVGHAVVDVVLLDDGWQGLLEDGTPGAPHHVPDQEDVHPNRLSAPSWPVKRPLALSPRSRVA